MEEFREGKYFDRDLHLNESKKSYAELGFTRFFLLGSLGAAVAKSTRKMVREGERDKGDMRQLGGMLVVRKGRFLLSR